MSGRMGARWVGLILVLGLGCGVAPPGPRAETPIPVRTSPPASSPASESGLPDLHLRSPAFAEGERIPRDHTCDGADRSPPLRWDPPPPGTRSLALIADDPDAPGGRFIHWVLYAIPPDRTELPEGIPQAPEVEGIGRQGRNDFGRIGYSGPCPPPGPAHRYRFALYALDVPLDLPPGARAAEVEAALSGHVLAVGRLMGRYGR